MDLLINIDVPDLEAGVAFYTQALDLKVGRKLQDSMIELIGGSSRIYLIENKEGTRASSTTSHVRTYQRHWTPVHFDVAVDDIDVAVRRAEAAGAKLEYDIQTHPYGKLAIMGDPFGHGFCLIQFFDGGYDNFARTVVPAT